MTLTKAQRARLAREARKLAMECVEGTAPELQADTYCGCAVGYVMQRALSVFVPDGLRTNADWDAYKLALKIDGYLPSHSDSGPGRIGLVSRELQAYRTEAHEAVIFPLLALADALDPTP